jgi:hypothetical protein
LLMLMLMLICCNRKTLFHDWLILADKLKRTEPMICWPRLWWSFFLRKN